MCCLDFTIGPAFAGSNTGFMHFGRVGGTNSNKNIVNLECQLPPYSNSTQKHQYLEETSTNSNFNQPFDYKTKLGPICDYNNISCGAGSKLNRYYNCSSIKLLKNICTILSKFMHFDFDLFSGGLFQLYHHCRNCLL